MSPTPAEIAVMLCRLARINPVLYDDIEDRVCWHRRTSQMLLAHALKCRVLWFWEPRPNSFLRVNRIKRCYNGDSFGWIEGIVVHNWASEIHIEENGFFHLRITPFEGVEDILYYITVTVRTTGKWKLTKNRCNYHGTLLTPVSYTHLTLPTILLV